MVKIVSVSSFGVEAKKFAGDVERGIDHGFNVQPIIWQLSRGPQKLLDLLDARSGKKVIVNVADQLVGFLEKAELDKVPFVIISQQAGSRIVEEALSMVKNLDQLTIDIKHILLAPEINGTEWNSIGKYAGAAAMIGLAGLTLSKGKKKGLATAVIGLLGGTALASRSTISDRIKGHDDIDEHKFAKIDRYVFYNPENGQFDGITETLSNASFYKGVYPNPDLISFQQIHLKQMYTYSKWFRQHKKSKKELIDQIIYST